MEAKNVGEEMFVVYGSRDSVEATEIVVTVALAVAGDMEVRNGRRRIPEAGIPRRRGEGSSSKNLVRSDTLRMRRCRNNATLPLGIPLARILSARSASKQRSAH